MDQSLGRFIPPAIRDVNVVMRLARGLLTLYGGRLGWSAAGANVRQSQFPRA
jgi:hypothetical protein